jgi:DNA replication and repair protein RecF
MATAQCLWAYLATQMFRLHAISLLQFKNYTNRSFAFPGRITGITGRNGVGKTNLLDAIHYLCFTKSYFTRSSSQNVLQGQQGFRLEGDFTIFDKEEKAICILRETGKKEFSINGQAYDKFSQHIGHYPCVIIAPDDIAIITGKSEERRLFVDTLLSQLDPAYLQSLIQYNKVLQQRNSLLRSFNETGKKDLALLYVLDQQLIKPGKEVFEKRKSLLVSFLPTVKQLYQEIAGHFENINLFYNSELLENELEELMTANQYRDIASQRTCSGIHKDNLEFNLNDSPFKMIASQGQRKSLLFALKLAEMDHIRKEKGFSPLLLLDDVFEKLDEDRISNLLQRVCVENDGQVFITDTNRERLEGQLKNIGLEVEMIDL